MIRTIVAAIFLCSPAYAETPNAELIECVAKEYGWPRAEMGEVIEAVKFIQDMKIGGYEQYDALYFLGALGIESSSALSSSVVFCY